MMQKLLLAYLRNSSIEFGKKRLSTLIQIPKTNTKLVFKAINNVEFYLDLNEYVMKQIYLFGIYEKKYVDYITSFPKKEIKTIIDIGANIGNYTLSFAKSYPTSIIHAFEPNTTNYNRLVKNIALNKFGNIKANQFGLSDKEGRLELYFDEKNMGASTLSKIDKAKKEVIELGTLDNYCDKNEITNIDLLKIDIEGNELKCLKGGTKILERTSKSVIQLEIDYSHCKRAGYSYIELFEFLPKYGYQPFLLSNSGNLKKIEKLPENFIGNVIYLKGH